MNVFKKALKNSTNPETADCKGTIEIDLKSKKLEVAISGVTAQAIAALVTVSVGMTCNNAALIAERENWSEEHQQTFVKDLMADFVELSVATFVHEIKERFGAEAAEDIRLATVRGGRKKMDRKNISAEAKSGKPFCVKLESIRTDEDFTCKIEHNGTIPKVIANLSKAIAYTMAQEVKAEEAEDINIKAAAVLLEYSKQFNEMFKAECRRVGIDVDKGLVEVIYESVRDAEDELQN